MRNVAVLALPGCHFSGIAAVLDLTRLANLYTDALFAGTEGPRMAMQTHLLTCDGSDVCFADGRRMRADRAVDRGAVYDVVYIASFEVESVTALERRLASYKKDVCSWIRNQRDAGARIAAAGTGILVLAQSGLLDGGRAAEPADYAGLMRRKYRSVRTTAVDSIVYWSGLYTASVIGVEPSLFVRVLEDALSRNLGDHLIKVTRIRDGDVGAEVARAAGPSEDDVVWRAQAWLRQRFTQKVTIPQVAAAVAVSQRTLARRFKQRLNMSPQVYLQQLRMEMAKRQLLHTERRVDRIALLVGYTNSAFFKEKFCAYTGMSPSAFRAVARAGGREQKLKHSN